MLPLQLVFGMALDTHVTFGMELVVGRSAHGTDAHGALAFPLGIFSGGQGDDASVKEQSHRFHALPSTSNSSVLDG